MDEQMVAKIQASPAYIALRKKRNRLGGFLTAIALIIYYGWIALIAFDKEFLSQRIGEGVTTIAVPIGIGVIVIMVILTAVYVLAANSSYDGYVEEIKKEVQK
ncbi:DUF485 domain-containing protein [Bartonella sp. LJL80]